MRMKKHEIDMTEGKMFGKIVSFCIPLVLTSLFQTLYNVADMVVVGRYVGDNALAAIGSTSSLINLIINMFVCLSTGATIVASQAYGARDDGRIHRATHTAIAMSLWGGLFLAVFGFCFARTFIVMMDSPAEIVPLATIYVQIYFLGMPFSLFFNYASGIMRAYGNTQQPLYIQFVAGIVNVVFNLICVIVFHMGIEGVAIATVISQALSAVLVAVCLCRVDSAFRLQWKKIRFYKKETWEILCYGFPTGMQSMFFSISNVMIQSAINSFGATVMAGHGAANYAMNLLGTVLGAAGSAAVTISSQNYGARKKERIWRGWWMCIVIGTVVVWVMAGILLTFAPQFLSIFTDNAETIERGVFRLKIEMPWYFFVGIMGVSGGAVRGIGKSVVPMVVALLGQCVTRILWLNTLFVWIPTLQCLYVSYPVTWALTGVLQSLMFVIFYKKLKFAPKKEEAPSA